MKKAVLKPSGTKKQINSSPQHFWSIRRTGHTVNTIYLNDEEKQFLSHQVKKRRALLQLQTKVKSPLQFKNKISENSTNYIEI